MSVVAVGSVRSCAATTLALSLAATWPRGYRVLLTELDPAGGTLAATAGWPAEPSLVSLAAAARHGADPQVVFEHCHALAGGAPALIAPASAEQARAALGMLGGLLTRLGELDADVVCDCGRLDPGSPALDVVAGADRLLLVARPGLSDLHAVATWLAAHPETEVHVALVAVGDGPYPDHEIEGALGVEVAGRLPWDPGTAEALAVVPASARQLRAAPLVRAARTLAERVAGEVLPERSSERAPAQALISTRTGRRLHGPWRAQPAVVSSNGGSAGGAQ